MLTRLLAGAAVLLVRLQSSDEPMPSVSDQPRLVPGHAERIGALGEQCDRVAVVQQSLIKRMTCPVYTLFIQSMLFLYKSQQSYHRQ